MRLFLCSVAAVICSSLLASLPSAPGFHFAKGVKFTVAGYTNADGTARSETLNNFPVLVRIAENSPSGFSYADVGNASAGDVNLIGIAFVDMDGKGLPFEIDTWNPSGESLVWVRLPKLTNGAEFVMSYGGGTSGKRVCDESPFSGYIGAWHMAEARGTVADSSGNGFHATPSGPKAESDCVAVEGPVGNGRQCSTAVGLDNLSYLSVPSYDSKSVGDTFAVSGWVSVGSGQTGSDNDARIFSRKENWQTKGGWEILWKTSGEIRVRGFVSGDNIKESCKYAGQGWKHIFIVYDGQKSAFYENGILKRSKENGNAATENDKPLGIGGYANDKGQQLVGSVDECRLLDAVASADWVFAEYASMTDLAFLSAGEAESYEELVDLSAGVSVSGISYTNATIGVSVGSLGAGAGSASVLVQLAITDDFGSPIQETACSVTEAGMITVPTIELTTNTTYFARAIVENNLGATVTVPPFSFKTLLPGCPKSSASVSGRSVSSISAAVSLEELGTGSRFCTARLEVSVDGFASVASFSELTVTASGFMEMEVSGLSPFTVYALRLRVVNEWGLSTIVDLGSVVTLAESGIPELFVDSLGTGNGSSRESALPTIRAALDIAGSGYTIWVRGGDDRSYSVANEADTLPIPAALEGLSIRAYEESPGDGGRAFVRISDTYVEDGGRAHIVSNAAEKVTIAGFDFIFGTHSVGRQNVGSCSIVWTRAPFTVVERCRFCQSGPTTYQGSGAGSPLVWCVSRAATNLVVRGCEFRNTRCWSAGHGYCPIKCVSNATIASTIFSNVNATVTAEQRDQVNGSENTCYNLAFVSNVVYGANSDGGGGTVPAFLYPLYPGPKSGEIAYNRFIAAADSLDNSGKPVVHRTHFSLGSNFGDSFFDKEATLVHHNTFIGGRVALLFSSHASVKRKNQIFSNLFLLEPKATNVVENVADSVTGFNDGRYTSFIAPSCLRNNAYAGVLTGGTAARIEGYDLSSGMEIVDNIVISAPLEFICTNDIYSVDFYRVRCRQGDPNLKRLGWHGENGEYPRFIGALPPYYPGGFILMIR